MKMSCKSQGSRLKAQSSKFKALFLNKAHGSKHKQEDFTKTRVCGFAGAYVTVGSTTWLGGSELMYIGAAVFPPPHLYGDVAKTVTQAGYAWAGYNADNKYPASSLVQIQPSPPFGDVAQLGERLPCKQEVAGSSPVVSTNFHWGWETCLKWVTGLNVSLTTRTIMNTSSLVPLEPFVKNRKTMWTTRLSVSAGMKILADMIAMVVVRMVMAGECLPASSHSIKSVMINLFHSTRKSSRSYLA